MHQHAPGTRDILGPLHQTVENDLAGKQPERVGDGRRRQAGRELDFGGMPDADIGGKLDGAGRARRADRRNGPEQAGSKIASGVSPEDTGQVGQAISLISIITSPTIETNQANVLSTGTPAA